MAALDALAPLWLPRRLGRCRASPRGNRRRRRLIVRIAVCAPPQGERRPSSTTHGPAAHSCRKGARHECVMKFPLFECMCFSLLFLIELFVKRRACAAVLDDDARVCAQASRQNSFLHSCAQFLRNRLACAIFKCMQGSTRRVSQIKWLQPPVLQTLVPVSPDVVQEKMPHSQLRKSRAFGCLKSS